MDTATNLGDLKAKFEANLAQGSLTLTPATAFIDSLGGFLATLPSRQVALSNATLSLDSPPTRLVVSGDVNDSWPIRGVGVAVNVQRVSFTFTPGTTGIATQLAVDSAITIGTTTVPMHGTLGSNYQLQFALADSSVSSISLVATANAISNNALGANIPNLPIFTTVPLSALDLSFGYPRSAATQLTFTSNVNVGWPIIDGFASLEQVGVTLTTSFGFQPHIGFTALISGYISAKLNIGQDFDVRLALRGANYWEVEVLPGNGNILPGLTALSGLAGGASLQTTVDQGLNKLGLTAVSLDYVSIGFDIDSSSLRAITIAGHITVESLTFNIQILLPNFTFVGSLDPSTPVHLGAWIASHFGSADVFPDITLSSLGISAQPSTGTYRFYASLDIGWTLNVGPVPVAFDEFDFDLTYGQNKSGLTGNITGRFTLAGVPFVIVAQKSGDAGWDFYGNSAPGQGLPIGNFIQNLAHLFGIDATLPAPIADLTISNVAVALNTQSGDFTFDCEANFPIDDKDVRIVVTIAITKNAAGTYDRDLRGQITIGGMAFDLHFVQNQASTAFAASYVSTGGPQTIQIGDLVGTVSSTLVSFVPSTLQIDLTSAAFGFIKNASGAPATFVIGFSISLGAELPNLSNLPLVGQLLPANQRIDLQSLQVLAVSNSLDQATVAALNVLLPSGTQLPAVGMAQGFTVSATLDFGGSPRTLALPSSSPGTTPAAAPASAPTPGVTAADSAKWVTLQKSFGPVYFNRVGVQYQDSILMFLLDASLTAGGLTIGLDGLGLGSPLTHFAPTFTLHGLGIQYANGPISIGGAFLRYQRTQGGTTFDEYNGAAIIKTAKFTLSAFGSYAYYRNEPSMFLYAILDYPLGGPAFFFVTGLAAGFGYNRSLIIPSIDQMAQFPLIAAAVTPSLQAPAGQNDLNTIVQRLGDSIPPSPGQIFFAIGVKFTSFKMIDSFALLTVQFGNEFEIDLLGISTAVIPTPEAAKAVPPLAQIQVALRASFIPDQGFLGVTAQLTSASYIFSRDSTITGGFAFYSWFSGDHNGEFVQTLGGYHPLFKPPSYYPQTPRLGLNWQVTPELVVKGNVYFALTASALMAGGSLQIVWTSGSLKAWLNASADFLLGWKPFHYDVRLSVEIGVSYTFDFFGTHTISADVSADLHLWGPDFSGTAHIDLDIVSFTISFGAGSAALPPAIPWDGDDRSFKKSFLPADSEVCGISVTGGLIQAYSSPDGAGKQITAWVVDPEALTFVTNSIVPSKKALLGKQEVQHGGNVAFGVAPVNVAAAEFATTHSISITMNGAAVEADFQVSPILKKMPSGMWGVSMTPNVNQPFLDNGLSGFAITPARKPAPGETVPVALSSMSFSPATVNSAFQWQTGIAPFTPLAEDDVQRRAEVSGHLIASAGARNAILQALGFDPNSAVHLAANLADVFVIPPQIAP